MTSTQIRPGDRFEHRRHLQADYYTKATCVVTAVRGGFVFYHDEPDGLRCKASLAPKPHTRYAGFEAEEVGRWLPRDADDPPVRFEDLVPFPFTRDTYVDGVLRNDLSTKEWIAECLGLDEGEWTR